MWNQTLNLLGIYKETTKDTSSRYSSLQISRKFWRNVFLIIDSGKIVMKKDCVDVITTTIFILRFLERKMLTASFWEKPMVVVDMCHATWWAKYKWTILTSHNNYSTKEANCYAITIETDSKVHGLALDLMVQPEEGEETGEHLAEEAAILQEIDVGIVDLDIIRIIIMIDNDIYLQWT